MVHILSPERELQSKVKGNLNIKAIPTSYPYYQTTFSLLIRR